MVERHILSSCLLTTLPLTLHIPALLVRTSLKHAAKSGEDTWWISTS